MKEWKAIMSNSNFLVVKLKYVIGSNYWFTYINGKCIFLFYCYLHNSNSLLLVL